MIGASRNSLALVQGTLRSRSGQGDLSALSAELLAAADVLAGEKSLRKNLADSGQPSAVRSALINDVFGSKVSALTVEVLGEIVAARWSSARRSPSPSGERPSERCCSRPLPCRRVVRRCGI